MDRRFINEIRSLYRGLREFAYQGGMPVNWYRYNASSSTSDPVYDTGPERVWYAPITVSTIMARYIRAPRDYNDDGLFRVDRAQLVLSYFDFFSSTMPDPDVTGQDHLNDRVVFDGKLFRLEQFLPQHRVADQFLTIAIEMTEIAASELQEDTTSMFSGFTTTF